MKRFVIMRGVPGSGKTTFARLLRAYMEDAVILSADIYFTSPTGRYKFHAPSLGKAHAQCYQQTTDMLTEGRKLVILDNTNINKRDYAKYIDVAKAFDYQIIEVALRTSEYIKCAERCVHNVPLETIKRMGENLCT